MPPQEVVARATAAAAGHTSERISEHAPMWQHAVIEIDNVIKGQHATKQVVVQFPASTDVRWHDAPKFAAGQEGVFMLRKGDAPTALSPGPAHVGAAAGPPLEYTALHAADVQPIAELPKIQQAAKEK
jgi:hypothetical protein